MKSFDQLQGETHAIQFSFLMTDAKAALTFLDVARTTRDNETRMRNREHAAVAYAAVQKFRLKTVMTDEQSAELDAELQPVLEELASFGSSESSAI